MEELQTPTLAATPSKAQPAKMLPLLTYPFSAFATHQISLTGFKYELLTCVRKLESQADSDAMMAQLDILQKKNKITEIDYQSFRAIVLGRSADDTYFQPPIQKPKATDFRQKAEVKPHQPEPHPPEKPLHTPPSGAMPQHEQSPVDHHATLFYTQRKDSAPKNTAKHPSQTEILLPEKKPGIDLRILSAIIVIFLLIVGEFFYLSWQKKQSTMPSTTMPSIVISNTELSKINRSTVTPNTAIENTHDKNLPPDKSISFNKNLSINKNKSIEQLWEKLQYSIDQQYLEPANTEGSAHFIFNQMLGKEPNHPLIQRSRIQLASAYLRLSKQARETNDWDQAEHYSQQAILVRNPEIFLPAEKK